MRGKEKAETGKERREEKRGKWHALRIDVLVSWKQTRKDEGSGVSVCSSDGALPSCPLPFGFVQTSSASGPPARV